MNILLTGGAGYIGSHAFIELLDKGNEVIILDNFSNSSLINIRNIENLTKQKTIFYQTNLLEKDKIDKILKDHKIDAVIHLAGLKSVGDSVKFPAKYYQNNVIGSKVLFECLKKNNIENLVFSSSATVYGKPIFLPLSENHPKRATNPYGQNKIDIESILLNDSYFRHSCSVKILRYFNPVGAHKSGLIGELPTGIPNNLMPYIVGVAKKFYPYLNIYGDNYLTHDGTGVRDYIHVCDLVEGHIKALKYNKLGLSIFNLGTGKGFSVLDLVKTFEKVNGVKIPFKICPRREGDVSNVFADTALAKNTLNFITRHDLSDMCKDAFRFSKNY